MASRSYPSTGSGSFVVKIPCLRTAWTRQGHWHRRRLGVYSKDLLGPAVEDPRSLALRTADRMNASWPRPICVKSQGCGTWTDHSEVSFLYKSLVRGLSAAGAAFCDVLKVLFSWIALAGLREHDGCPRLREPKFCMSAVVRGVACFVISFFVVRGCPRREKGLK